MVSQLYINKALFLPLSPNLIRTTASRQRWQASRSPCFKGNLQCKHETELGETNKKNRSASNLSIASLDNTKVTFSKSEAASMCKQQKLTESKACLLGRRTDAVLHCSSPSGQQGWQAWPISFAFAPKVGAWKEPSRAAHGGLYISIIRVRDLR